MASGGKPEFAPLLPPGRHLLSLTVLQTLCLDRFPRPTNRDQIFAAIELLVADLVQRDVRCELWIDGSFLTEKHDPDDADLSVVLDDDSFNLLDAKLQADLYSMLYQKNYHC